MEAEGTPGYLPPEVLMAGVTPGWTVDYWSLGCVLYFCLYGRPKYYGTTFEQVLFQMASDYTELSHLLSHSHVQFNQENDEKMKYNSLAIELIDSLLKYSKISFSNLS